MARILIVDDELPYLRISRLVLEDAGHEVVMAASGQRALELARESPPDAVIVDYMLPGVDGAELLRRMREVNGMNRVPAAVISAAHPSAIPRSARARPKPTTPEQFHQLLDDLLGGERRGGRQARA